MSKRSGHKKKQHSRFSAAKLHLLIGTADVISQIEEMAALKAEDLLTAQEFRAVVDGLLDA